jgi:hypothetical protein
MSRAHIYIYTGRVEKRGLRRPEIKNRPSGNIYSRMIRGMNTINMIVQAKWFQYKKYL